MPYFDHVRCHSCKAMLDPESLVGGAGLVCPRCGVALNLSDLFGLSDAFAEEEEEGPVSLDELVPGSRPRPAQPAKPAPSAKASKKAPAGSTALVKAAPDPEPDPDSALAAMRAIKRKK